MSWVVVPFSRPERLEAVRANFARQRSPDKKICIVENGPAIGVCKAAGFDPDMLLTSDPHPSIARNVALDFLREEDAHFCCMDDDDWYGPEYLAEHRRHAARGRITGKVTHWVRWQDSRLNALWLFNRGRAHKPTTWVHAATLGAYARDIPDFPTIPLGEENVLCKMHRAAGGEVINLGVGHFLYSQGGQGHAYQTSARMFAHALGPWFETHPLDLSLVEQENPPTGRRMAWNHL